MKNQKGFITPALVVVGLLILGGLAYYSFKSAPTSTSTPAAALTANTEEVTSADVTTSSDGASSTETSAASPDSERSAPVSETAVSRGSGSPSHSSALIEVTQAGTLAQRLALTTLTDIDYSFAISYPKGWTSSGPSNSVLVTNGRSSVAISSEAVQNGATAESFAAESGVAGGFITTSVNAYRALETVSGAETTYYIVNGAVGYKVTVSDFGDTGVLQTMLLTFTVTRQR